MQFFRLGAALARRSFVTVAFATVFLAFLPVHRAAAVEVPSPIRLNTVGYPPGAVKQASIALPCTNFSVIRLSDGATVFAGTTTGPMSDPDTREQLYMADFSKLKQPGEYQLDVPGVGRSAPFQIAYNIYREPFRTVMRGFYLWRCGTAVQRHLSRHDVCPRHLSHQRRLAGLRRRRAHAKRRHQRLARRG